MSRDDPNLPPDLTVNQVGAIALHEIFTNLVSGGFTERQALVYLAELGAANRARQVDDPSQ